MPRLAFRSIGDDDSDDTKIGLDENELDEEVGVDEGLEGAEDEEGPPQVSEE